MHIKIRRSYDNTTQNYRSMYKNFPREILYTEEFNSPQLKLTLYIEELVFFPHISSLRRVRKSVSVAFDGRQGGGESFAPTSKYIHILLAQNFCVSIP